MVDADFLRALHTRIQIERKYQSAKAKMIVLEKRLRKSAQERKELH